MRVNKDSTSKVVRVRWLPYVELNKEEKWDDIVMLCSNVDAMMIENDGQK
jgi:hypothetical protein